MSAMKVVACSFVIWGTLTAAARAEPILAMESASADPNGGWICYTVGGGTIGGSMNHVGVQIKDSLTNILSNSGMSRTAAVKAEVVATPPPPAPPASNPAPTPNLNPTPSGGVFDGFINFGNGPLKEASTLTTGSYQPWFNSNSVRQVFGGNVPTPDQQTVFEKMVLNNVNHTFNLSGLTPSITLNPGDSSHHTISVASGLAYPGSPEAIGITDVGNSGFSFIDKLSYAKTPDELAWAVAHNITHELMHAFGVAQHDDQSGDFLDAAVARWSLLTDPSAQLSGQATRDILAGNFDRDGKILSGQIDGGEILASPVPEPATIAAWSVVVLALTTQRRRLSARFAA